MRESFWAKVNKSGPVMRQGLGACWEWTGARKPRGYGNLTINRRSRSAHRVSFEMAFGVELGRWMLVLHKCDNPPCVNPAHLFIGSNQDNHDDAERKGRLRSPGATTPATKLKPEDVAEIRRMCMLGIMQKEIAQRFNTTQSHVSRIKMGLAWKRVEREEVA